jgi:hypothetical protein
VAGETKSPSLFASSRNRTIVICLLLAVATLAVYNSASRHPFVNYDDDRYVTANVQVRSGLSWHTVSWAFTSVEQANWHPLTWLSHALDYQLFGMNPAGHHYVNVLLHAANVMLLFLVLYWATGFAGRSAMVAALFALHPINVESVVWVSERKNLLSMLFFLLAIEAYRRYAARPAVLRYVLVAVLFACGLMAKPQVITLPMVLLLLDYWPLNRWSNTPASRLLLEKLPLLLLSAASAVITMKAQRAGGAMVAMMNYSLSTRVANAVVTYWRYLGKAIWPARLAPFYPYPEDALGTWKVVSAALLLLAITILVILARRRRYLAVGWFWFLGTLVPMIGLVQVGDQAMADRYAYLPFIGLFMIACWGVADLAARGNVSPRWLVIAGLLVLLPLVTATSRQIGYWSDDLTLWSRTLAVTKDNYIAEDALGGALVMAGRFPEALPHFREAVRINPSDGSGNLNLAAIDQEQGNLRQAISRYQIVVRSVEDPQMLSYAFSNMGFAYRTLKDPASARQSFETAVRSNPNNAKAWMGLGLAEQQASDFTSAAHAYATSMGIQPSDFGYLLLSQCLEKSGHASEARAALAESQRLSPNFGQTQKVVASLLAN